MQFAIIYLSQIIWVHMHTSLGSTICTIICQYIILYIGITLKTRYCVSMHTDIYIGHKTVHMHTNTHNMPYIIITHKWVHMHTSSSMYQMHHTILLTNASICTLVNTIWHILLKNWTKCNIYIPYIYINHK